MIDQINGIDLRTQGLGEAFLEYLEQAKRWQEGYSEDCERWQADLINAIHQGAGSLQERELFTGRFTAERENNMKRKLLERLHISEITERHDRIAEAYAKTFQWIHRDSHVGDRSWTSLVEWLEGDYSVYWITGKAGSGKSTLMKYLYNNTLTFKHLKRWASEKRLIMAAFFFWNSGTDIQMSQNGLYRALLCQILTKFPVLIPRVLPARWEVYRLFGHDHLKWGQEELRQAFKLLAEEKASGAKYCFFIDGIDEFNGDHTPLVDLLKDIGSSGHIKICVSSRPWVIFEDAFKHKPSLMLQDLTYPDIKHFISSKFQKNPHFMDLENREPQYAGEALEGIAQKAAGIFLWVHLVVQSLLAGLVNGDRVSDLQRRLDFLPPELGNLYEKMPNSLDPFYLKHASQYFQIIRAAQEPPSLLCLSFTDEVPDFVQRCKVQPLGNDERLSKAEILRRRLNSRCRGLLEVASGPVLYRGSTSPADVSAPSPLPAQSIHLTTLKLSADSTVHYLHKTVKDFLESPEVWTRLLKATQVEYSPHLALCRSFIVHHEQLDKLLFWRTVEQCLRCAYIFQESESLISMLDELDRAATQVFNAAAAHRDVSNGKSSKALEPSWTCTLATQDNPPRSFLSLAVRLNLRWYVEAKAKKGCLVVHDNGVWPLLADAIHRQSNDGRGSVVPFDWRTIPSIKMIKLLLDRGADPNWSITRHQKMKLGMSYTV